MLSKTIVKEWLGDHKGLVSFFWMTWALIVLGMLWSPSNGVIVLFWLISTIFFFAWVFFVIKWAFLKAKEWVKKLPSVGKNIVDNAKIMYSDEGDTDIDKFLQEIVTLEIADIHDTKELEDTLQGYARNINTDDITEIDKKRLIKKTLKRLSDWTEKAGEDYLVTEWEMMVWLWLYNIISTLSDGLTKYVSKSEGEKFASLLDTMKKYHTIYMLTIKNEYPECEVDIALKTWEKALVQGYALLQKTKSVREIHWYSGFATSIRIAKGFSYRIGTVKPITSTKTVQYTDDIWQFLITNQRVGFIGAKQNFLIPIDKLIQFEASWDGLFLMKENTTKLHHIVLTDYDIPLLVLERLYKEIKEPEAREETKLTGKTTETKALPEKKQDKANSDYMDEIAKLGKLKDDGLITEEEFTEKKKKILWI